jgi:hypothetical protein
MEPVWGGRFTGGTWQWAAERLSREERERLCDILDSGPAAYGLETGIWTSPLVQQVIEEELGPR